MHFQIMGDSGYTQRCLVEWPGMSCHLASTEVTRAATDHPALVECPVMEM